MQQPQFPQATPAAPTPSLPATYPAQHSSYTPNTVQPAPYQQAAPQQQQQYLTSSQQHPAPQSLNQPYSTPQNFPSYQAARAQPPQFQSNTYNPSAPRPIETFRLNDNLNASIPENIRSQDQTDDNGRVLFFSTPPLDVVSGKDGDKNHGGLSHSLKYMAARDEGVKRLAERKRQIEEEEAAEREAQKKQRTEGGANAAPNNTAAKIERFRDRALIAFCEHMAAGTEAFYKHHYGENWEAIRAEDEVRAEERRKEFLERQEYIKNLEKNGGLVWF